MSQTFTFQNAPIELLDVPQLVLLTDTTQKVDTRLMDRFFLSVFLIPRRKSL